MNILNINPYIRRAMRSELVEPFCINRRVILDYELLYIEDGKLLLIYNDREFLLEKGDVILICPGIPHSFHSLSVNLVQPHIHFDLKYDDQSDKVFICFKDYPQLTSQERLIMRENLFPRLNDCPKLKINDMTEFLEHFYQILDSKDVNSLSCKSKMLELLSVIISDNAIDSFDAPIRNVKIAFLIKSFIDYNYKQEIRLEDLEKQFNYSKFYLAKKFKQEYGISIINYVNNKRMSEAIKLLPQYSVSKTAQLLGFSSIYSFSRAFRISYGVSPTTYIKEIDENSV